MLLTLVHAHFPSNSLEYDTFILNFLLNTVVLWILYIFFVSFQENQILLILPIYVKLKTTVWKIFLFEFTRMYILNIHICNLGLITSRNKLSYMSLLHSYTHTSLYTYSCSLVHLHTYDRLNQSIIYQHFCMVILMFVPKSTQYTVQYIFHESKFAAII